ncbi:17630_t:CDS:2 [Rhizophagus irregularis]|nr:17630_t:CDS:2 [Rhizophagus irregularis]
MYQCNFCKRCFSRKQDLTQYCHQLHTYTNYSRTLNWVQDQQSSSNNNIRQKTIDNNVWNEIEGLDIFLQITSADDKQNNEKSDLNNTADAPMAFNKYENDDYTDDEYHEITRSRESKSISSTASSEDFCGVSLADAYKDLNNNPEQTLWPSETYKEFMMAVTQYRLSDAAADSMLRILKKHCTDQLPGSTRKGRTFIDNMDVKGLQFKEKELIIFEEEIYKLHYRPIYDAIKSLVSNSDLTKDFLFDYDEQWEYGLEFKQKQRDLKHRALKYLLGPLLKEDGIYLAVNGKVEHFTIYLSSIIADMLEAQDICCTYKSYRTRCPCYKCLMPGDQLNNMNIKQDMIDLRNHENMQEAIASHNAENYSIHEYDNFFWNFRIMNIYDAAALDHMHLQEIGLFPYMLDYTRGMLMHQYGKQIISKMDNRLATITRFNNLRILKKGYQQGTKFTGGEMRDVMKIIVFVLDELYTTDNKINN